MPRESLLRNLQWPFVERRARRSGIVGVVAPNIVSDQTMEKLRKAVTPSEADVAAAKLALRSRLDHASVETRGLVAEVLSVFGIPAPGHQEIYEVKPELEPDRAIDPEHVILKRLRMEHACKLALAELGAEGVIVAAETPQDGMIQISVHRAGHSGGENVPVSTPLLASAYRVKPRLAPLVDPPALSANEFASGLGTLLSPRALECLDEALAAARRGLYLSAVNMLGAVSEAAWYEVGAGLEDDNPDLAEALANSRTGEVQRLIARVFTDRRGRARSMCNELIAHASYLRDLRNYGVHPVADQDPGQAHAFTEMGCMLLIVATHRYLARLREAAELVGLDFSPGPQTEGPLATR